MSDDLARVPKAERDLRYALNILAHPVNLQPDEWLLVATLIGEADLVAQDEKQRDPTFRMPLLDHAISELRELTGSFTDPAFLSAARAARRRNKRLFAPAY